MYIHGAGIFTYKTGLFLGQMLVNIPYMEHMGYNLYDHIYYIYIIYIPSARVSFLWFQDKRNNEQLMLPKGNFHQNSKTAPFDTIQENLSESVS